MILLLLETGYLTGQRDEVEESNIKPRTRSTSDSFSSEKHEMAAVATTKLKEMDEEIASLSTSDLRDPLYSSASEDDMLYPAQVEVTYHTDDPLVTMAREIVQATIHNAVALCEYVDTIVMRAIQHIETEGKDINIDNGTLKSPEAEMTYEERFAAYASDSLTSSDSAHEHPVDKLTLPTATDTHLTTETQHDSSIVDHTYKLSLSDSSSGDNTPLTENVEVTKNFRVVKSAPLVHSLSLEEDAAATPIIELNQIPICTNNFSHQQSHDDEQQSTTEKQAVEEKPTIEDRQNNEEQNTTEGQTIEEKQNVEEQPSIDNDEEQNTTEKQGIEERENVEEKQDTKETQDKENIEEDGQNIAISTSNSNMDDQTSLGEKDDSVGELSKANGEIKINVVPSIRHDDGSLSPEPSSFSKLVASAPRSKGMKKEDTLDGKIFGSFFMHQSDSLPSFPSHTKLVDPDSISLVINQCNEEDMEHSDEEILIAHSMDSTTFIDEYLDTASLDSTSFSQESRDNLVFPNSPVALRHNKQSIIRRRYDAGRFDETSPVKEEEKNGFAEFAELFEQTFQLSRSQRERSSSPHSNKVTSVFVFEGSHKDDGIKVSSKVIMYIL